MNYQRVKNVSLIAVIDKATGGIWDNDLCDPHKESYSEYKAAYFAHIGVKL